ncbi:MAG: hypothetical protein K2G36_07505, partial [Ruminococcus sp.]|nr:hypothetical protein [Ruminococcus sp.]
YTGTDTDTTTTTTDTTDGTGTDTDTTTTTDTTDGTGTDTTTTDTTDDGSSTSTETTTTPFEGAVLPGVVRRIFATVTASDEGDYGFYYSYETEFHKEQVKEVVMQIVYTDGTEGTLPITYDFASTPAETFEKYDVDFKYTAALVYNGGDVTDQSGKVVLKNGDILKTSEDEDAGVVAYIGYRGDVNLDYAVNAVDASQTQAYYAELSTGKQTDETVLSESKLVESASSIYDDFAAFLGDVNMSNQKDEIVEWRTGKKGRALDAIDATGILTAYAELSTNTTYAIGDKALWDAVLA